MGEQSSQCNGVLKLCSFNSFWTTMKLCSTEELTILGFDSKGIICWTDCVLVFCFGFCCRHDITWGGGKLVQLVI